MPFIEVAKLGLIDGNTRVTTHMHSADQPAAFEATKLPDVIATRLGTADVHHDVLAGIHDTFTYPHQNVMMSVWKSLNYAVWSENLAKSELGSAVLVSIFEKFKKAFSEYEGPDCLYAIKVRDDSKFSFVPLYLLNEHVMVGVAGEGNKDMAYGGLTTEFRGVLDMNGHYTPPQTLEGKRAAPFSVPAVKH